MKFVLLEFFWKVVYRECYEWERPYVGHSVCCKLRVVFVDYLSR